MATAIFHHCNTGILVIAERLVIPLSIHPPNQRELDYHPGDWIICSDDGFSYLRHAKFCEIYLAHDDDGEAMMGNTNFPGVVDESTYSHHLLMTVGKRYGVSLMVSSDTMSPRAIRGEFMKRTDRAVWIRSEIGNMEVEIPYPDIKYVYALEPEELSCSSQSKESTDQEKELRLED
jgi:hypothetical protein